MDSRLSCNEQEPLASVANITRRSFQRAFAAAALYPSAVALGLPKAQQDRIHALNPTAINYLMADEARRSTGLTVRTDETKGCVKRFWVEDWRDPSQVFAWITSAPQAGDYAATLMINVPAGTEVEITGPHNRVRFTCPRSEPQYSGQNWNRITLPEPLSLPSASSEISIRLLHPVSDSRSGAALKSIELLNVAELTAMRARVRAFRSDTAWLDSAKFGLMCQCGEWAYPQQGAHRPWPAMANGFDVNRFADMVASTGAGYAIWSATWATYYFPAPIAAIDRILPGRTSKRDLIGEIAEALEKRNIRVMLYYHAGHSDPQWWLRNWVSPTDKALFFENWCAIIGEVGERYGKRLAGWLFDDELVYYPAPYERLGAAAKAGNRSRIISYNPWIQARGTDFQDFQFGEGFTGDLSLPKSAHGIWPSGPQEGLHAHGNFQVDGPDWGVQKENTRVEPPRFTADKAVQMALEAAAHDEALSWNLLMFDDGSVSETSLNVMQRAGHSVRHQHEAE